MRLSIEHDDIESEISFTNFYLLKEWIEDFSKANDVYSLKLKYFQNNPDEKQQEQHNLFLIPFIKESSDITKFSSLIDTSNILLKVSSSFFTILTCDPDDLNLKNTLRTIDDNLIHDMIQIEAVHVGDNCDVPGILLPSCPVCISRIDKSITGINSIACSDIYHSCCLEKCKALVDRSCKACELLLITESNYSCYDCGSLENLWICLICGNIGCGRYKGGHAHNHFLTSNHSFALNFDSYHIWDYCDDKYVHRSIMNAEGTTVILDDSSFSRNSHGNEIAESEGAYFNDILAAQLESQKAYYDERLIALKKRHEQELLALNSLHCTEIKKFESDLAHFNIEKKVFADHRIKLQESFNALKAKAEALATDLEVEKKITQGLAGTIEKLELELNRDAEIKLDLEDQIKDLMKHMEVLDLMNKAGNDPTIVQGQIYIRPPTNTNKKSGKNHCK